MHDKLLYYTTFHLPGLWKMPVSLARPRDSATLFRHSGRLAGLRGRFEAEVRISDFGVLANVG